MADSSSGGSASLAALLRRWRERALLTQAQLAARAGLGIRTIRRIESGSLRRPRMDSVRLLADALELAAAERARLTAAARGVPTPPGPRQLPAPPQMFTGRAAELADLDQVGDASAVVITAIDGMAGVGKTALAIQTAHRLADRFQDGQLFVDLRGYADSGAPAEPAEVLDRMLRGLGVPGEQIPAQLEERAALYRSRLAGQQVLILLDNAATEEQVRPLLPGTPGCLVLVTSRRRLAGLDHTHTVSLDTLPLADAVRLLARTTGEERLADQPPELLAEAVELCGQLPLAIRIAAARLRHHPAWSLEHLVDRLREHQHRLAELEAGHRSVAAALDLSYQQLTGDLQRSYRLLGLHPGPDLTAYATAALIDAPAERAHQHLDRLFEDHLLQEPAPGRYRFHDLVRAHAAQLAATGCREPDRRAALGRLFDHYAHTAATAMDRLYPHEADRRPHTSPAGTPGPTLDHTAKATTWLDAELPNLLATAYLAADHGRAGHLRRLSRTLHSYLRTHARYADAEALHQRALDVARDNGDRAGELAALMDLGEIRRRQGRSELAAGHFEAAMKVAQAIGDRRAELDARLGAGRVYRLQGRYRQAIAIFQQVLDTAPEIGSHATTLTALGGLADVHRLQGRYGDAVLHFGRVLETARTAGNRTAELTAMLGLGEAHRMLRRYERAVDYFRQALAVAETTGNRTAELSATVGLGGILRRLEQHEQATASYQHVLDVAREIGNRNWQFEAVQGLGRVHHATGRADAALACHEQALAIATEIRQPDDQARAHDGLAHAHHALGRHEPARRHWRQALDILTTIGTDHTEDEETTTATIGTHLAGLDRT